jgi:hypothetical protein
MTEATTTPNNAAPVQNPTSQKADQKNASTSKQTNRDTPSNTDNEEFESLENTTTENENTKLA